jgi:hypothetical protein
MNFIHHKASRTIGLVAVLAAVAAGIAAEAGNAASSAPAGKSSYAPKAKFKAPKLKGGLLTITGTKASDKIALRLATQHAGRRR